MKQGRLILVSFLIAVFAATSFGVGRAYATISCFNDTIGNPFETFICWMKDNGITSGTGGGNYSPDASVTRGQMAVFMQRQAEIPPSTGNILISASFQSWKPFNSSDPLSFGYFSSHTQVFRSAVGLSFISINPDLPTVLYGRSLRLKGVQFCFDTRTNTTLNYVEINTYSHTSGDLGRSLRFSDATVRTGSRCQLYTLPTPIVLTANDGANFFAQVSFAAAGSSFAIGRTTFIMEPTTTIAANPLAPDPAGATGIILQPATADSTIPDTSAP